MKKILAIFLAAVMLCCTGCVIKNEPVSYARYITKYVTNTEKLDIREEPSNTASIVCSVEKDRPLSFVEDSENGYSKVVYDGVTGYALSSYLTLEKPKAESAQSPAEEPKTPPQNNAVQPPQPAPAVNSSVISNRSESEIEEYITSYVRPHYNEINSNLDSYSKYTSGGMTVWSDSKGCIKKEFTAGTSGYDMARQYYYDTDSGRIAFAFIFGNGQEYRLYFRTNQLVRYIGPDGNVVNNPTSSDAVAMAEYVLSEAY